MWSLFGRAAAAGRGNAQARPGNAPADGGRRRRRGGSPWPTRHGGGGRGEGARGGSGSRAPVAPPAGARGWRAGNRYFA